MSDIGCVTLKLRPGEFVRVGDAVVTSLEQEGESVYLAFTAPRSVPIVRSKQLSDAERERLSSRNRRSA